MPVSGSSRTDLVQIWQAGGQVLAISSYERHARELPTPSTAVDVVVVKSLGGVFLNGRPVRTNVVQISRSCCEKSIREERRRVAVDLRSLGYGGDLGRERRMKSLRSGVRRSFGTMKQERRRRWKEMTPRIEQVLRSRQSN